MMYRMTNAPNSKNADGEFVPMRHPIQVGEAVIAPGETSEAIELDPDEVSKFVLDYGVRVEKVA